MNKYIRISLLSLFLVGVVLLLGFIYKKSQKKEVIYESHSPVKKDITKKVVATGSIIPEKQVDITPNISGVLEEVYSEPGDIVKKGDILAKVTIVPNMVSLNSAESRLRRAKISLEDARREYDRNKTLVEKDVISEVEFQRFKLAYSNAEEELQAAQDNLLLIKRGVTQGTQKQTNTLIRSTISGMVLDIPLKEGSSVIESNNFNNGTIVAQVADMNKMVFEGVVDESEVDKLKIGMSMRLTVGAIDDKIFNAKINYISPKGKEDAGAIQFDIKASVELREDAFIRAGYSANANIIIEERKQVLALNEGLLQFDDKGTFVEVEIGDQQFEKRYVETGLSDGIFIEVISGLGKSQKIKQWDITTTYNSNKGKK